LSVASSALLDKLMPLQPLPNKRSWSGFSLRARKIFRSFSRSKRKFLSELQSVQEEVVRREELRRALSAQAAIAGGSGLATDSRSFLAAESNARRLAERDIVNVRLFGQAQSNRLAIGSEAAKARGKNALSQGTLGAAGSIIGGVGGAFSSFAGSGLLGAAPGGAPGGKTLFARTGVRNSSGQI
jgi:hypothetical protein